MLSGKSILFIGRNFFGYDRIIRDYLLECGASVDYLADVPYRNNVAKAMLRVARPLIIGDARRRILRQVSAFGRSHYDFVFTVIGEGLDPAALRALRADFPRATFLLHIWDSIDNNRAPLVANFAYFDSVSSFDRSDAAQLGLGFRPLFFSRAFDRPSSTTDAPAHDACFVGTAHSDRSPVLHRLKRNLDARQRRAFIFQYLQAPWLYHIYNALDGRYRDVPIDAFSFQPLPQAEVARIVSASRVVVDIPHSKQQGLTIRTLECLGMGRKLATTNPTVVDYDFYAPDNICVMDRRDPDIPDSFMDSPYRTVPDAIRSKYSLEAWVADIFDFRQ